ncbi:MAG: alpha/beta hydrolase [Flavobacteriales bacterium]|nr:alpha/beta hydrolase [Flavobacteriales bacterium]
MRIQDEIFQTRTLHNLPPLNIKYKITGQGQPLLFIHGAYISDEVWERQVPYFAEHRYRVINVLLPSHGDALPMDIAEYRVDDFTNEVVQLLDHLRISACVFIGLSLGSMIAQNFAARFPERTRGIVLLGNVASMRLTLVERTVTAVLFPKWLALRLFGSLSTKQFIKLSFMLTWFMRGNKWLGNKDTRQKIRDMISQMKREEIKRIFAAVHTFRKQNLASGDYPILLVNGQFDSPVIHHHARHIVRNHPYRARFERIAGSGHACNYDDPDAFNALLKHWLEEMDWTAEMATTSGIDCTSEYNRSLEIHPSN